MALDGEEEAEGMQAQAPSARGRWGVAGFDLRYLLDTRLVFGVLAGRGGKPGIQHLAGDDWRRGA